MPSAKKRSTTSAAKPPKRAKTPAKIDAPLPYKLTPEQKAKADEVCALRDGCLADGTAHRGQMLVGPPGDGKTGIVGCVNREDAPNGVKVLNLFVTSNPKQADAQADEVGADFKALTKRKIESKTFAEGLASSSHVTATITPTVLRNLVDGTDLKTSDALLDALLAAGYGAIHLQYDEVHKACVGRSKMPALAAAWRERLGVRKFTLIVTGITATPMYKGGGAHKSGNERARIAQRYCTLLGIKGEACTDLDERTVEIDTKCHEAITSVTRKLQTRSCLQLPLIYIVSANLSPVN